MYYRQCSTQPTPKKKAIQTCSSCCGHLSSVVMWYINTNNLFQSGDGPVAQTNRRIQGTASQRTERKVGLLRLLTSLIKFNFAFFFTLFFHSRVNPHHYCNLFTSTSPNQARDKFTTFSRWISGKKNYTCLVFCICLYLTTVSKSVTHF